MKDTESDENKESMRPELTWTENAARTLKNLLWQRRSRNGSSQTTGTFIQLLTYCRSTCISCFSLSRHITTSIFKLDILDLIFEVIVEQIRLLNRLKAFLARNTFISTAYAKRKLNHALFSPLLAFLLICQKE